MQPAFIQYFKRLNRARLERRHAAAPDRKPVVPIATADERSLSESPVRVYLTADHFKDFHFRPASVGDRGVIRQIFVDKDYELIHWEHGRRLLGVAAALAAADVESLVVDAGANIGASGVYFHEILPRAKVVCIEPDDQNCRLLRTNLEGSNAVVLEQAISCRQGSLTLLDPGHGDWGFQTTASGDGRSGRVVSCTTVPDVLRLAGLQAQPLIAKIDIEGAEQDLFEDNCDWMDRFPCIIIELHDWMLPGQGSSLNFFKQLAARHLDFLHRGENVFLFNMRLIEELEARYDRAARQAAS